MEIPDISKEDLPPKVQDLIGDNDFVIEPLIDEDLDEIGLGPKALSQYSREIHDEIRKEFAETMGMVMGINKSAKKVKKRQNKKRGIVSIIDDLNKNPDEK